MLNTKPFHSTMRITIILLIAGLFLSPVSALKVPEAEPPRLNSASAVLYDLETETLLFEKQGQTTIPPASLTKIMGLYLAYQAIGEGRVNKSDIVQVSSASVFQNMPPHSSLMFLEQGQNPTLLDIMRGLAIPSGNDAGVALAEFIAGGLREFVELMNDAARTLGMTQTVFVDASGYSENNLTTARDLALLCMAYTRDFPEAQKELHSLEEYTYPRPEHLSRGAGSFYGPVTQYNHNPLVNRFYGINGIKTGFIEESGFNLAVTAYRGGRRLLAVILGGPGSNPSEGNLFRSIDAVNLLSYGFFNFTTFTPGFPGLPGLRVWGGAVKYAQLTTDDINPVTLTVAQAADLQPQVRFFGPITAPVSEGQEVGEVVFINSDNRTVLSVPIRVTNNIPEGAWWQRFVDAIIQFFSSLKF